MIFCQQAYTLIELILCAYHIHVKYKMLYIYCAGKDFSLQFSYNMNI